MDIKPNLVISMSSLIFGGYIVSIIIKLILGLNVYNIVMELNFLAAFITLFGFNLLVSKQLLKYDIKKSVFNSLLILPVLSVALGVGILFFDQPFLEFKLTTIIIGSINLIVLILSYFLKAKVHKIR